MFENLLALSPLVQTTHIRKPVVPQMPVNWDCRQDIELNTSYHGKSLDFWVINLLLPVCKHSLLLTLGSLYPALHSRWLPPR